MANRAPMRKPPIIFLAFVLLREPLSPKVIIRGTLITLGAIVMIWK